MTLPLTRITLCACSSSGGIYQIRDLILLCVILLFLPQLLRAANCEDLNSKQSAHG
jgi:hypothetical protein